MPSNLGLIRFAMPNLWVSLFYHSISMMMMHNLLWQWQKRIYFFFYYFFFYFQRMNSRSTLYFYCKFYASCAQLQRFYWASQLYEFEWFLEQKFQQTGFYLFWLTTIIHSKQKTFKTFLFLLFTHSFAVGFFESSSPQGECQSKENTHVVC